MKFAESLTDLLRNCFMWEERLAFIGYYTLTEDSYEAAEFYSVLFCRE